MVATRFVQILILLVYPHKPHISDIPATQNVIDLYKYWIFISCTKLPNLPVTILVRMFGSNFNVNYIKREIILLLPI